MATPDVSGPERDALAEAWHDVACPEGLECRDRHLHARAGFTTMLPLIERAVIAAGWRPPTEPTAEPRRECLDCALGDCDSCEIRRGSGDGCCCGRIQPETQPTAERASEPTVVDVFEARMEDDLARMTAGRAGDAGEGCTCVGYTIRTDYGTGIEHDVDRSDCPIHGAGDADDVARHYHYPTTPVQCACGWRETDPDAGTWQQHMDQPAAVPDPAEALALRAAIKRARIETAAMLGWSTFGTHVDQPDVVLEFAGDDDGVPEFERAVVGGGV